jgi:hypothetical protein
MINTSSGFYGNVAKKRQVWLRPGAPALLPDVPGAPQNTVIGGASLGSWRVKARGIQGRGGVLQLSAEVRSASHKRTGYLPVTTAAYELTESPASQGKARHRRDVTQMIQSDRQPGHSSGQLCAGPRDRDEELEQVWSGKPPRKPWTASSSAVTSSLSAFESEQALSRDDPPGGADGKTRLFRSRWLPWVLAPAGGDQRVLLHWPAAQAAADRSGSGRLRHVHRMGGAGQYFDAATA